MRSCFAPKMSRMAGCPLVRLQRLHIAAKPYAIGAPALRRRHRDAIAPLAATDRQSCDRYSTKANERTTNAGTETRPE